MTAIPAEPGIPNASADTTPVSPIRRSAARFLRRPLGALALAYLILMILVALFGSWLTPEDPNASVFIAFEGPSTDHWLGTDDLGRDTASRLIAGTAASVRAAYQTVAVALAIAIPLGLMAGYAGGVFDNLLMRLMDALNSFPALVLALVIAAVLGPGLGNAMIAITIVLIPTFVRLCRASTLAVSQETYVDASRSIGTSTPRILLTRVLPGVLSPLIISVTLLLGVALTAEASLSFLGLGVQAPQASWGGMLRRGYNYIFSQPYQMIPPGVAIALAVLSFNIVGDTLRDALSPTEIGRTRGLRGRAGLTLVVAPEAMHATPSGDTGAAKNSQTSGADTSPILSVRDLEVTFQTPQGPLVVVDGVSFDVGRGEVVGLVGESGSGKTVTSLSIMRLLPSPPARITAGEVWFGGQDLLTLGHAQLANRRGGDIAMVFQDPMSSLNPAFTIGNQLTEAIQLHQSMPRRSARHRALELLALVGIADAERRLDDYPHRLSGGMRQRVLIAMALANEPKLLIADEPTTALDVTVQAQILDLLRTLQSKLDMAMVFVTHDLGVVADIADRVLVMYAGQLVESSPAQQLFDSPQHPYTERLLAAIPQSALQGGRLASIPGEVPVAGSWEAGCRFSPRCEHATDECRAAPVPLEVLGGDRTVRCVLHGRLGELGEL